MSDAPPRHPIRDGIAATAPMLLGVVPFGLVAGAAPVAAGFEVWHAIAMSAVVFAGASQLAISDVLGDGGSAGVAVITALTINLRMVLYSASLAPTLAHEPLRRRLAASYFLVDQAYALAIVRWDGSDEKEDRLPYYFAVGVTLWVSWQISTVVGAVVGARLPEDIPLEFSVPLVFLVLLVPVLSSRPALAAAVVGGLTAVLAAELGVGRLSIVAGGVLGIVTGTWVETLQVRAATRREVHG